MKDVSTRSRIILLVILAALPTLALIIYSTWDERVRAEAHAREDLTRVTRQAAQQLAQIVEGTRQTLVTISLLPSAMHNNQEHCNDYLRQLLAKSSGLFHSMGLYNADSLLICNAVPWQGKVHSPDRLYLRLALTTGKFAVGEYQIGRVTKQQGINFGFPLTDASGKVSGVAFLAMDLNSFKKIVSSVPLPRQGILTVTDRSGIILARYPDQAETIGQKLPAPRVLEMLLSGKQGVFESKGSDGTDRLFAYESVIENPDGSIPLRVMISLPQSVVFADANATLIRNLVCIILATILLIVAAWYGAEIFMLRSIRTLLAVAKHVESGSLDARTGLLPGKDELAQLGRAFDNMAQALQSRDVNLKRVLLDLEKQAITDPLTELYNRRFLYDVLPRELARAWRKTTPVAVMMIDIDHFKRVNDTYGHETGDLVIKEVAHVIKSIVRGSDYTCRYGGEEIVVVLAEAPAESAQLRAESIRSAVQALEITCVNRKPVKVTVSIGIAIYPVHGADTNALLRAADEALYEAKGAGRNRVVVQPAGDTATSA